MPQTRHRTGQTCRAADRHSLAIRDPFRDVPCLAEHTKFVSGHCQTVLELSRIEHSLIELSLKYLALQLKHCVRINVRVRVC